MTVSEMFVEEVQDNRMTPINILDWYRNFYRLENNNTEQGIIVNAINDIFMRLTDMGLFNDERLLMSNEEYRNKGKYKIPSKYNDNTLEINGKLLALINIISSALDSHKEVSYNLELLENELKEERNHIEREELM
nr:MAG TPA: hypothetical protein [Caudoviricetes sp.]